MSKFNKSYRIRTEVGKDTQLHVNLDRQYKTLEIMSLKINQENAYKLHSSNYGVIAGRVLANEAFGIPNAKISVFINIDSEDIYDVVKSVLYPYNTTYSKDKNGVRYNLLPNEQLNNCHTIIGTFPEKQYMLDNDSTLEIFDKYFKYTTRTNNVGDYMIFGVPVGSQTIHVDIDLSDIGILSQKPRDMVYKGYNIEQFENPNKFKYDTNLESLTQVISQDNVTEVIPFWGDENENTIGITRCDVNIQYKFEPTCVFMGSVVSDTASNGISKKCIPTPGMGSMEEITTGSGTIEMIRKTPSGDVEEFQIKGTQLINGDGVWCYQIPMNLDYVMTDEFGNIIPTNDPKKGIPTRTRVRFRISMQDFDTDSVNMFRCKMLVPHNPNIYSSNCIEDYQFGTKTSEDSYRDLFWNCIYSVKSYIPRIQKGANWKNEKFTGFKRVNYYGNNNPIPYNNIRVRIPFMYMILCVIIKFFFKIVGMINWTMNLAASAFVAIKVHSDDDDDKDSDKESKSSGGLITLSGELCDENLENLCIIPGVDIGKILEKKKKNRLTLLGYGILKFYEELGGTFSDDEGANKIKDNGKVVKDEKSIDYQNKEIKKEYSYSESSSNPNNKNENKYYVGIRGIKITDNIDYLIQCVEMNLAQEFKVIQFDFYNDWINGLIYIPRWMRTITKKKSFFWGLVKWGGKVKACNENYKSKKRNIVQQCGVSYDVTTNNITTNIGCKKDSDSKKLVCHKSADVRLKYPIFKNNGVVKTVETLKSQYVYYFKPYEIGENNKKIRLYATDIILLGSLTDNNLWGIPNNISELVSSTYQLPPNLALTDSDLEGNDYTIKNESSDNLIAMDIKETNSKIIAMDVTDCYSKNGGLATSDEAGNYTEISGIDWGYEGPLQKQEISNNELYKPGGHFLGLTCRNSETTIKTCVNLSRICEYGVWMSQRHELNIPDKTNENNFLSYATIPTGLISKDEIGNDNYRRLFATMNHNRLKTKINGKNGYPMYDFIYLNPTNFNGELTEKIENVNIFNSYQGEINTEKEVDFIDDNYYYRGETKIEKLDIPEKQIIRTGEYLDEEYYKYRFGLTDGEYDVTAARKQRFLNRVNESDEVSFPMYNNSFYFYFGLHDGKTALDELKKTYYAVCEKTNETLKETNNIVLQNLSISYDGVCEEIHSGRIMFNLSANNKYFNKENKEGFIVSLKNDIDGIIKKVTVYENYEQVMFNPVAGGTYKIIVENITNNKIREEFTVNVGKVSIKADLKGVNFKTDVSKLSNDNGSKFYLDNLKYGGCIIIKDNTFKYEKNVDSFNEYNVYESRYIKNILIKDKETGEIYIERTNNINKPYTFQLNSIGITKTIQPNENGEYMIPVPHENKVYSVYIKTYGINCHPTEFKDNLIEEFDFYIGDVEIKNGSPLNIKYNNVSYSVIEKYIQNTIYPTIENMVLDNIGPISKSFSFNANTTYKLTYKYSDDGIGGGIFADSDLKESIGTFGLGKGSFTPKRNISSIYFITEANRSELKEVVIFTGEDNESYNGWWSQNLSLEDEKTLWRIKENLFQNSLTTPHKVNITVNGGVAPYTETITGMKDNLSTSNITRSDFENITVPSINYLKNGKRRYNFSYQVEDNIGVDAPKNTNLPFVFPVIYKPFFIEMGLWYFANQNQYYLYGNIYNGITWSKEEGFNAILLNSNKLQYLPTIIDDDFTIKINEPSLTSDKGGYDYQGSYFKYNGRKTNFNYNIQSPDVYFNVNNNQINNITLNIGCNYNDEGDILTNSTFINKNYVNILDNYTLSNIESDSKKYLKIDRNNKFKYYLVDDNKYKYPLTNNKLNVTEELFRSIMEDNLTIENVDNNTINGVNGYIDIQAQKDTNKKLYYIIIGNESAQITSNNEENKLKTITVSELIDFSTL